MKQPDLGKKILELRQQKGYTQEELVTKCNLNVRTLQRIENGEVTPRSYTVKTLLAALDHNFEELYGDEVSDKGTLLHISDVQEASIVARQIRIAWIAGIIFFFLGFVETTVDWFRFKEDEMIISKPTYILVKVIAMVSYSLMMYGFLVSGKLLKNYLLKISSMLFLFAGLLFYLYDMVSIYHNFLEFEVLLIAELIILGCIGILFGIAILKSRKSLGIIADFSGSLELFTAFLLITIIFSWLGLIFLVPLILLEIIVLYKVGSLLQEQR